MYGIFTMIAGYGFDSKYALHGWSGYGFDSARPASSKRPKAQRSEGFGRRGVEAKASEHMA